MGRGGTIRVDGTKLHVDQVEPVQIQILLFCERLRLARGLAPRASIRWSDCRSNRRTRSLSANSASQTTFTFLPWTRLADVVRHWQESTGVTILVDWEALAKEELAPATPIACSVDQPAVGRGPRRCAGATGAGMVGRRRRDDSNYEPDGSGSWSGLSSTTCRRVRLAMMRSAKDADDTRRARWASGRLIVLAPPDVHRKLDGAEQATSSARIAAITISIRTNASPIGTP